MARPRATCSTRRCASTPIPSHDFVLSRAVVLRAPSPQSFWPFDWFGGGDAFRANRVGIWPTARSAFARHARQGAVAHASTSAFHRSRMAGVARLFGVHA